MKYLFAVNPVSGNNKAKVKMNELAILLRENQFDFLIYETQPYHYAVDLRSIIIENEITHVFAVGGDGTAHEVLNAVVGLDVFFGVIPFGSGNDFARVLKLPNKINKVFEMIKKNNFTIIDVGKVKDRYFLNYISLGFDVAILQKSLKFKKIFHSGLAYLFSVISSLVTYKCKVYTINDSVDKYYLLTIHNGKFYGGGMKINPFSEINDGLLNLCTVKKMNRIKLLFLFPSVFSGKHFKFKKLVKFETGRKFLVEVENDVVTCGIDGELYEFNSPIKINIVAESVKMIR